MSIWSDIGSTLLNAFVGTGGGFASSALGGGLSYGAQKKLAKQQYEYNLALQKQSQDWQAGMSNSAFQRQVDDLRKAGLNPLMATGMSGASTGSVGASSVSQGSAPQFDFANSINTASETRRRNKMLNAEIDNITSQTESNNASAWRDRKQASLFGEQARNEARNYDLIESMIKKNQADILNSIRLTNANVNQMDANTRYTLLRNFELERLNSKSSRASRYVGDWLGAIGNVFHGSAGYSYK